MTSSDYVLSLVRQALDEFDAQPLEVSVRRAVRIASLVGDSRTAVRLGYELRPAGGGDRRANAADVKRLMTDPSTWGTLQGPSEEALQEYFADRKRSDDPADDTVLVHSVAELEFWVGRDHAEFERLDRESALASFRMRQILELTRNRTFTALIAWERQFTYSSINESIFSAYQRQVDQLLSAGTPDLVEKFTAVYQRLREAAALHPELDVPEELSQAITTCRRILKAVVDHVFPPVSDAASSGHSLDDAHYRNRLYEFISRRCNGGSHRALAKTMVSGLYDRFEAVDTLTNKAVHAEMALEIANLCALNTYIVCGEVLRVHLFEAEPEPPSPA
ncbi:MAG TPA: hypothetical protein VMA73_15670 [Streptosporangiaceae bacterium]|nr:hypothetical protein [Streptosporangiaceae bacterium]